MAAFRDAIASRSLVERAAILVGPRRLHDALTPAEREASKYCWALHARPLQRMPAPKAPRCAPGYGIWRGQILPPGDWSTCLVMAGRGSGKTRFGAEMVRRWAADYPGCRIAIVGATAADVWGTMLEGESGILSCCPTWDTPAVHTTKRRLLWRNGSRAILYSADKPRRLRGPQQHFAWADEIAAWRYIEAFDQLMLGLRKGEHPRVLITTTPLPLGLLRDLSQDPNTALIVGSSRENAGNLSPTFFTQIVKRYVGTVLERQELEGELLDELPGAMWKREWFRYVLRPPRLKRILVGIDPAETSGAKADDTGIVACGLGEDDAGYVLEDASVHETPDAWARCAVDVVRRWGAGAIVADVTRGGEMVRGLIRLVDPTIRVLVKGGNRGKRAWAEPVSALYEQGRVWHVSARDRATGRMRLTQLEDQMCTWTDDVIGWSPDRMDAAVYALTELMLKTIPSQVGLNAKQIAPRRM